ncbi:putative reverse transcriptase domain-containing protein [Tanacetum coccineum]
MCTKMVPRRKIGWRSSLEVFLRDNIQGNVIAAEPTRLQDAVRIANNLMDQKLKGYAVRNAGTDALLDITPYALDVSYAIELADGRTSETNTVFMGYTLGLLGHPFNIDLMPIELGSFDVIIDMDWLAKNHAVIVCDEKIVRIPYRNEILIVQGDKGDKEKKSKVSIISCEKGPEVYRERLPTYFWPRSTVKENKGHVGREAMKDVPTVRDFPEVFPEDLLGLPPTRQVEFQLT